MVIISDWYVIGSTQISWKAFHLPITSTKVQNTTTVAIEKRRAYPHCLIFINLRNINSDPTRQPNATMR